MSRRLMLRRASSGGGGLPSEYQRTEYIGISASGAYIATDYTPVQGDEIAVKTVINGYALGTILSAGTDSYQTVVVSERSRGALYIKMFQTGTASQINFSRMSSPFDITIKNPTSILKQGTIEVSASTPFQEAIDGIQSNLWIFRRRNGANGVESIIYSFAITNNGLEKLNLIPCYRKSDNVIGMYDTVSRTFYTNAGSGAFIKGADV